MIHNYLKQLTQISIINFFFILGLLFFIQKKTTLLLPQNKINIQNQTTPNLQKPSQSPTLNSLQTSISPTIGVKKNLFSELSLHNLKSDCWLAVQGHIYDVTTYFGSHPGGDGPIQKYCGTDATTPFTTKDGIGADHSASAYDLLHQYLIQ